MSLEALVLWMPAIVIAFAVLSFVVAILPRRDKAESTGAEPPDTSRRKEIIDNLDRDVRELRQISGHVEDARRALGAS
jgi:hypothetical protein